MVDDKKGKKGSISGVKGSKKTGQIQETGGVENLSSVEKAAGISKVGKALGIGNGKSTGQMSLAEREQILKMVEDEAKQFFKNSGIPKEKQEVIEQAVKMAIDTGLIDEPDDGKQ